MKEEETITILSEKSKIYYGGELCVMLIIADGEYFVDVVNQTRSFGRIKFETRKEAEFLFQTIEERIFWYSNVNEAEKALDNAIALISPDLIVFAIYTLNRNITQDDIVYLRKSIHFRTIIKKGFNYLDKQRGMVTIYIVSDFGKKPIGFLVGTEYLRDLKFRLL
ncbi:MAG: hypothetical protein WCP52_02110 [Bacteroidota bacterium]